MIFDPVIRAVDLTNPVAWCVELRECLIRTRTPFVCDCCGTPFLDLIRDKFRWTRVDVHEGIVTKGDIRGWKLAQRTLIFTEYNCVLLDHQHHLSHPPSRQAMWDLQVSRYGEEVMKEWYFGLPFRNGVPRRFWDG